MEAGVMRPAGIVPRYDGITRKGLEAYEERRAIYLRDRGLCQACNKPIAFSDFEIAHRIANTKANRRRWGAEVIDHPLNKYVAHRGRCNDACNIGGRPMECQALAQKIHESLKASSIR
jgi:hypothetical protein